MDNDVYDDLAGLRRQVAAQGRKIQNLEETVVELVERIGAIEAWADNYGSGLTLSEDIEYKELYAKALAETPHA